jgi:hypothetical protein
MADNWVQRAFDATRFTASGSMTWTVDQGDVFTDAYIVIGNTVIYSIVISGTTTTGTASTELRITLPSFMTIMRTMDSVVRLFDGTNAFTGYAHVTPGLDYIRVTKFDVSNFPLVANGIAIQGQIAFEIE